jgi:FtsH-binding integral membrane protein
MEMNYTNQNQSQRSYENFYPNEELTNDQIKSIENNYISKQEENKIESSLKINLKNVRKTYDILCFRLLITSLFTLIVMLSPSLQKFMLIHPGLLLLMAFLIICFIFTIFMCMCNEQVIEEIPKGLLLIFSISESYIVGFISSYINPKVIFLTSFAIFTTVIILALYSINTTTDIIIYGEIKCIFLMAIILFFIFSFFTNYSFIYITLLILVSMFACFYIICEIQYVEGDYMVGGFMIYTDIVFLCSIIYDKFHH